MSRYVTSEGRASARASRRGPAELVEADRESGHVSRRGPGASEQRTGPRIRLTGPLRSRYKDAPWSRPGPCSRRIPATGFGAVRTGMKRHLEALIRQALIDAITAGELPVDRPPPFAVEVPADLKFGDLATNVALVLARQAGKPPRVVAETVLARLRDPSGWLASAEIAGPGFINVRFTPAFWRMLLAEALAAGDAYGRSDTGAGRRVHVEFVSANPTGPLHVGHGRGAVLGDVAARLLEAAGFQVEREYYVNDFGRQMDVLGRSTWIRYRQLRGEDVRLAEDAYPGEYLVDVARALAARRGEG